MKVVFFNRFFHPDSSATSQMLSDLAFHLASTGHEVHVVSSRAPGGKADLERYRGVTIHRVVDAPSGQNGLAGRTWAYLGYYRGARRAALTLLGPGDVAVIMTDPPLLSSAIVPIVKSSGSKAVVWLQDLFPEVAREYGIVGMKGPIGAFLGRMRDRSLTAADLVVSIGERMAARVAALDCVAPGKARVVHNWADGHAISPVPHDLNFVRAAWSVDRKFVVGYSGNLGRVHEFDTLLDAAALLRSDPRIVFLIVGRGPRLAEVKARAERESLDNVRFLPHQQRDLLAQSLGAADVHVCVLRPEFEGLVHPSKLYGIMAAGRPSIFIGDRTGEAASILTDCDGGMTVDAGDATALAAAIRCLRDHPAVGSAMGARARQAFDERYEMAHALRAWEGALQALHM